MVHDIEEFNTQLVNKLQNVIKPFMIRRTKAEELQELPEKRESYIYVGLTKL